MHLFIVEIYNTGKLNCAKQYKNVTKLKNFAKNYCIFIPNVLQCEHPKINPQQKQTKIQKQKRKKLQ
jgi:hypothetical protein